MAMEHSKSNRRLKVYPKYRLGNSKTVMVPEIRLCGKWLRELGFQSGHIINIETEEKKITITVYNGLS
jgi:toxic protein SymE